MFPSDGPTRLPPFRRIERQIDFVLGAILPNIPTYRTNLGETKEIESQVQELLHKGGFKRVLACASCQFCWCLKRMVNGECVVSAA